MRGLLTLLGVGMFGCVSMNANLKDPILPLSVMDCFNQVNQIVYVEEPEDEDYWQTPEETEELGTGDCEDMAFYLDDLLDKNGHESRYVMGLMNFFNPDSGHVWVEYKIGNDIYVMDSTGGFMIQRDKLPWTRYVGVEGMCENKMEEYQNRLGE